MTKKRNSNIELLRIISIIMIVLSHYCVHGNIPTSEMNFCFNRFMLEAFSLGHLGSIIFVLITGYYLINSNKVIIKKLIHILSQIIFYSISIYFLLIAFGYNTFSIKQLIEVVFPITYKQYWFATCYVILYLFHPYINVLLNNFKRKDHFKFICIMFVIFSILHALTTSDYYGNELIQFLLFYAIGAYLRKYPDNILSHNNNNIKIMIISSSIIVLSIIVFDTIGIYNKIFNSHSLYFLSRTSPFSILFCCSLFDYYTRKKEKNNSLINKISLLIFGVYLISDNNFFRTVLWNDIFNNFEYIYSPYLIIHIILSVSITIIICLLVEFVRKVISDFLYKKLDSKIDNLQDNIEIKINKFLKMN